jgi:hypothetical protein
MCFEFEALYWAKLAEEEEKKKEEQRRRALHDAEAARGRQSETEPEIRPA